MVKEEVTRVDFSLNAVRNTCIVISKYGNIYAEILIKKRNIAKDTPN